MAFHNFCRNGKILSFFLIFGVSQNCVLGLHDTPNCLLPVIGQMDLKSCEPIQPIKGSRQISSLRQSIGHPNTKCCGLYVSRFCILCHTIFLFDLSDLLGPYFPFLSGRESPLYVHINHLVRKTGIWNHPRVSCFKDSCFV